MPAATPEIPGKAIPAKQIEGRHHARYIGTAGIAFKPMGYDGQAPAAGTRPVEIQKVIVRGKDSLAGVGDSVDFPEQRRENSLNVTVFHQGRRIISRVRSHLSNTFKTDIMVSLMVLSGSFPGMK